MVERSGWSLITEFLDYLRGSGLAASCLQDFPGPAKHLIVWLERNGIALSAVDVDIVRQFLAHDCDCPRPPGERYQKRHLNSPTSRRCVLRFTRFLEDTGRVHNPMPLDDGLRRVAEFTAYLVERGYKPGTVENYERGCRHFVVWLNQHRVALSAIDEGALERFEAHDCLCPGMFIQKAARDHKRQVRVRRFVRFLATIDVVPTTVAEGAPHYDPLPAFRAWMRRHRGSGERTILDHASATTALLPQLGDDPGCYDAALIRRVMLQNLESRSRIGAQQMCGSLRMYLRFLAATGACSPALVGAIPRIPRWRLATLPRYILNDDVERVIASCDPTTARGLRDRAILLLLARLALRGGDVANLDLRDIDWDNALIRVAGKTRHAVALPLPQDVGDALLAYLERARPVVDTTRVFIRVIAPFQPFASSSPIAIVVRDALKRAGVENANLRGAYLLRHSAATNMLRNGATLDAVGAVLRHRSPETTAIYAKVDVPMLLQVAQPWIGSVTCR